MTITYLFEKFCLVGRCSMFPTMCSLRSQLNWNSSLEHLVVIFLQGPLFSDFFVCVPSVGLFMKYWYISVSMHMDTLYSWRSLYRTYWFLSIEEHVTSRNINSFKIIYLLKQGLNQVPLCIKQACNQLCHAVPIHSFPMPTGTSFFIFIVSSARPAICRFLLTLDKKKWKQTGFEP